MRPVFAVSAFAVLSGVMVPSAALACTWCSATAFGDRTFNWPYLTLILAPFAIGVAIAGVLSYYYWPRPFRSRSQPESAEIDALGPRSAVPFARSPDKETT